MHLEPVPTPAPEAERARSSLMPGLDKDDLRWLVEHRGVATAYQPIVDVRAHRVVGWEALLRAQHPSFGAIGPVALVEAAAEHGLLGLLTRRVIDDAWHTMAHARDLVDEPLTIHLNLEPSQLLADEPLLEWLAAIAWPDDVRVVAEITERGSDRWLPQHEDAVSTLLAGGLALAIDDFGSGPSRLDFLNSRHWDVVKLDRFLLQDGGERPRLVLAQVAELLSALGATSLAEGVETLEHYALVRELGIDEAQGYLFGMPVPGAVILADLAKHGLAIALEV